jgi:hypothetical protein
MARGKALIWYLWSSQLPIDAALTPLLKPSRCTTELKSSSSYEEQYTALYNAFTEAQRKQSTKCNEDSFSSTSDDSMLQSPPFLTGQHILAEIQIHEAFLDFISTATPTQFRSSTMSSSHDVVEPKKCYQDITTSLDFSSFGLSSASKDRLSFSSDADTVHSTAQTLRHRESRTNPIAFSDPPYNKRATEFGSSSSYLDSLSSSRQSISPPVQFNKGNDDHSLPTMTTPLQVALTSSRQQENVSDMASPSSKQSHVIGSAPKLTIAGISERTVAQNGQTAIQTSSQAHTSTIETITVQVHTVLPRDVTI